MMKTFILISPREILFAALVFGSCAQVYGQDENWLFQDSTVLKLSQDAVYNRPFLQIGKAPIAIGGYLEANSQYVVTDGISEGLNFQMQRLTLFFASTIKQRIKFLSEIEFEDGTKEINIEFAALDLEFAPLLVFRGGIVMIPIGAFNQNHDGPKWEFVNRPISATSIIPSTWSNVGFGFYGKSYHNNWVWGYEIYLTNGFDNSIIDNDVGRTWLPSSKESPNRFGKSFNGIPLTTLKTTIRHRKIGELGLSWMGDVYNTFKVEGIKVDEKRRVDVLAVDFNSTIKSKLNLIGEWVWVLVDVPDTYSQQYGSSQTGGFADLVYPVLRKRMLGWENSSLNVALRLEYVDYNMGTFRETGDNIYDHLWSVTPAVSFRPSADTVIRLNYSYLSETDLLGNPPSLTAGLWFGISSYF